MADRADGFRLLQAPLGVHKFPGNSLGWHMIIYCGMGSGLSGPGMGGHKIQIRIKFDGIVRSPQPELFMGQRIRCGVISFFKLNMAVAVDFDLTPGSQLYRNIRQGF